VVRPQVAAATVGLVVAHEMTSGDAVEILHALGDVRRLDLHLFEEVAAGSLHYGGVRGEEFPPDALAGVGRIDGRTVRCESLAWSLRWHRGYAPRDQDRHDVALLCVTFGFELPDEFA
jgi:lincosamide nucleotidyltransferase A/C/D/E